MSWIEKSLDELGLVARGKSKHRPRDAAHLYDGPYPFIQTGDVKHAPLYLSTYTKTYSEEGLKQSKLWKKGTLCITIAANIADTAILDIDACFPDSVIGFVANEELCDTKFIKYTFNTLQQQYKQFSQGAAQDNLSLEKLLSIKFKIPSLLVQQKIAGILSTYDDLIDNNRKRIALLEKAARLLYEEWFVRLQFPGHEHTPVVDGVPEGWEKASLSKTANFINGYPFKPTELFEDGFPIVKIPELRSGVSSNTPRNDGQNIPEKYWLKDNDLLFSWSGTLLVNFWHGGKALLNQHLFKVVPLADTKKPWLYLTLNKQLEFFATQSVGATMKHIRKSALDDAKILLPTHTIADAFNAIVSPIFQQFGVLQMQTQKLQQARDLLLPRLMSGELAV